MVRAQGERPAIEQNANREYLGSITIEAVGSYFSVNNRPVVFGGDGCLWLISYR